MPFSSIKHLSVSTLLDTYQLIDSHTSHLPGTIEHGCLRSSPLFESIFLFFGRSCLDRLEFILIVTTPKSLHVHV
jgi:hypothetical protein